MLCVKPQKTVFVSVMNMFIFQVFQIYFLAKQDSLFFWFGSIGMKSEIAQVQKRWGAETELNSSKNWANT